MTPRSAGRPASTRLTRRLTAALLPVVLLGGCVSRVHEPYDGPGLRHRLIATPAALFEYPSPNNPVELSPEPEQERDGYEAWRLITRPIADNGQPGNLVKALYYRSLRPGPRGLVIVLPIWGSSTYPPEKISAALVRRSAGGLNVLRVEGPNRLLDYVSLEQSHDETELVRQIDMASHRVRHAVIDARRLIDWAQTRPEIDPDRIAMVGFSISAVVAALVYQNDPRLAALVAVMGSAQLDEVITTCPGRLQDVRDAVVPRLGLSRDQYRQAVRESFAPVDPGQFRGSVDGSRVLLIDAVYDSCMPRPGQDALWLALGRPERISMRYDHKVAFLAMTPLGFNILRREIVGFLSEKLAPTVPVAAPRRFDAAYGEPTRGGPT